MGDGMDLLIIDDERLLVKGLKKSLEQEGFRVVTAYDGEEGLRTFQQHPFDFIILDLMLPKLDGMTLCKKIRETSEVPIIMLTAKDEAIDKILGLELGADDYMTKPFHTRELIARIRAIARRLDKEKGREELYQVEGLRVEAGGRRVLVQGQEVELTPKEFDILLFLLRNRGQVFSREQIFSQVWNEPCLDTRTIDVHIKNLREKLREASPEQGLILTKWGVGYYFRKD